MRHLAISPLLAEQARDPRRERTRTAPWLAMIAIALAGCDGCGPGPDWDFDRDDDGYDAMEDGGGDCDDHDASVHPGAVEVCNDVDDDCDERVDDADKSLVGAPTWYLDGDGDGYGDPEDDIQACVASEGFVADATDCDDGNANVNPAADEICNGFDDDCDEETDEEDADGCTVFYEDGDEDGYGAEASRCLCGPEGAFTAEMSGDCDDADDQVHPGAEEHCDGVNEDCDKEIDEEAVDASYWFEDADGDDFGNPRSPVRACEQPMDTVSDRT
ncbi:MAG: putative metal-binding motif-containing protein, partial [Deltaproteobacteria bacterium]|nr:putative metal-binding motif-containing protein [Deltaproteobacteria bacterium]